MVINFIENCGDFKDLSDEQLRKEFASIKWQNNSTSFVHIVCEAIKRMYNYAITKKDIEILEKFLDKKSLNVSSNDEVFYPYLIYSLICNSKEEKLYSIYMNRFLLLEHYSKTKILYEFLDIKSAVNLSPFYLPGAEAGIKYKSKLKVYSTKLVFSSYEEMLFDYINDLSIDDNSKRADVKPQNAFIFDIDKVVCDLWNCLFRVWDIQIKKKSIKIKDYFKKYKTIIGVSSGLFLRNKKFLKKIGLQFENINYDGDKILDYLKNPKNIYCLSRAEKIEKLTQKVLELNKEEKTVVIDVDNKEDLSELEKCFAKENIKYSLIDNDKYEKAQDVASILTGGKITVLTNLMGVFLNPVLGGDCESYARIKATCFDIDSETSFYKDKFEYELKQVQETAKNEALKIEKTGGVNLIFASHYIELDNEYHIINNYIKNLSFDNIAFYNCPQDEIFTKFRFDKIKFLENAPTEQNKHIFEFIFNFLYRIRKYLLDKASANDNSHIIYSVADGKKNNKKYEIFKIAKNSPCYCGSGLKYKKCCAKVKDK